MPPSHPPGASELHFQIAEREGGVLPPIGHHEHDRLNADTPAGRDDCRACPC
jgi:hypothetical protein